MAWCCFLFLFLLGSALATRLEPIGTTFPSQNLLPAFSLRLGEDTATVCNSSTPGTSGYVDSEDGSHLFFWLFESKDDSSKDPIILWMTGGPGSSSIGFGNLMELGPCRIGTDGNSTVDNPFGWNTNATLLFVDQPVSVGYSYSETNDLPQGLNGATTAMHQFLQQFFIAFPQLANRDFYIAGESYGGSWVPTLAARIIERQTSDLAILVQSTVGYTPEEIKLKGIMIGNGLISQGIQNPGSYETVCAGPEPLLNATHCERLAPIAQRCETIMGICQMTGQLGVSCDSALGFCGEAASLVIELLRRNPYDFRRRCDDAENCYTEETDILKYLNLARVKDALGVPEKVQFNGQSPEIWKIWAELGETWLPSVQSVNYLLDQKIRVLIYVGNKDLLCHSAGMRRLVDHGLNWKHHMDVQALKMSDIYANGRAVAVGKALEPLTYAEVDGAGHMLPFDKPEEALMLINAWIHRSLQI